MSMDCIVAESQCWLGQQHVVELRSDAGQIVASLPLPRAHAPFDSSDANAVFADPRGNAVWVWQARSGHLVHMRRDGTVTSDHLLDTHSGSDGMDGIAADRDHRLVWIIRAHELLKVDFGVADPQPRSVMQHVLGRPVADLTGGVWLVTDTLIRHIDGTGRTLSTVALSHR